ncbi:DNA binding protein with helix-turn-helix domain (plasmid) [Actinoalloteichus sp. GBA129-24]|nr:DNA binding protein with helix-turn-helix domain [Actinoalloteichus sp. GBA129-24]
MCCMAGNSGNAATRAIGEEVASYRKEKGLSARSLATLAGFNVSTISRVESGKMTPSVAVLSTILARLDVVGPERERLLSMVDAAAAPQWIETGAGLPHQLHALLRFERSATSATEVHPVLVPGLLQAEKYTRAILRASNVPDEVVEARVAVRMGRQRVLPALAFEAIIDETVLLRPLGGSGVMAEQCELLLDRSKQGTTVRVLPIDRLHPALNGAFSVFRFPADRPIIHLEHLSSGVFIDDPERTPPFLNAVDSLRETAMSPADSQELIAAYRDRHRRNEAE